MTSAAPRTPRRHVRLAHLVATIAAVGLLAGACSSDGDTTDTSESGERELTTETSQQPSGPAADTEFCTRVAALDDGEADLDLEEDPQQALSAIESIAEVAPEELSADFEVFVGTLAEFPSDLPEDDPNALASLLELFMDPDFLEAQSRIGDYVQEECGLDIDGLGGSTSDDAEGDTAEAGTSGEVTLEEIDAVEDANDDQSWEDKLSSTVINGQADVQLGSGPEPFTEAEALQLCNAMVDALSADHPELQVSVTNGEDTIVRTDGGTCTAA